MRAGKILGHTIIWVCLHEKKGMLRTMTSLQRVVSSHHDLMQPVFPPQELQRLLVVVLMLTKMHCTEAVLDLLLLSRKYYTWFLRRLWEMLINWDIIELRFSKIKSRIFTASPFLQWQKCAGVDNGSKIQTAFYSDEHLYNWDCNQAAVHTGTFLSIMYHQSCSQNSST